MGLEQQQPDFFKTTESPEALRAAELREIQDELSFEGDVSLDGNQLTLIAGGVGTVIEISRTDSTASLVPEKSYDVTEGGSNPWNQESRPLKSGDMIHTERLLEVQEALKRLDEPELIE